MSLAFADGEVRDFRRDERGTQLLWQVREPATGYYNNKDIGSYWQYGFWHATIGTRLNRVGHSVYC